MWEKIKALINAFTAVWPDARFGPAHIVLSDYNLYNEQIRWCILLIVAARAYPASQ